MCLLTSPAKHQNSKGSKMRKLVLVSEKGVTLHPNQKLVSETVPFPLKLLSDYYLNTLKIVSAILVKLL